MGIKSGHNVVVIGSERGSRKLRRPVTSGLSAGEVRTNLGSGGSDSDGLERSPPPNQ